MSERVMIDHEGTLRGLYGPENWRHGWGLISPEEDAHRHRVITEGTLWLPDGQKMPLAAAKRVKARLMQTSSDGSEPGHTPGGESRCLIPDVLCWDIHPDAQWAAESRQVHARGRPDRGDPHAGAELSRPLPHADLVVDERNRSSG
ncbi:hypothetical protein FLP10_16545 [Agromyces intestinalis]|uniref:Uncharacterized protein n=1 Tax=Agromyces intestinalis TaxID=2592652 RepID=A0A5C1YK34_9MICO|nr:hypothetical protein [Agromyces intestinalis]QEO15845.1 hypothetical protein FLP10_16545 [Agromyces intestinalis]